MSNQEAIASRPEEKEAAGLDISPEEHPCTEDRKREGPLWNSSRRTIGQAFKKDCDLMQSTKQAYFPDAPCTDFNYIWGPRTSRTPFRIWPPLLASWTLKSMKFRRCRVGKRTSGLLTVGSKGFPKGHPVFPGGACHRISQDHGTKGDPFSLKPSASKQDCPSVPGAEKKGRMRAQ